MEGDIIEQKELTASSRLPQNGELERFIFSVTDGVVYPSAKLPRYVDFPLSFTSDDLDHYATLMGKLTTDDPYHRERGAIVYIKQAGHPRRLIFPSNPAIGEYHEISGPGAVQPISTKKPYRFYPVVGVHSHPDDVIFSDHDVFILIAKSFENDPRYERPKAETIRPSAELLSTTDGNFILIRTQDTQAEPVLSVKKKLQIARRIFEDIYEEYERFRDKRVHLHTEGEDQFYYVLGEIQKYSFPSLRRYLESYYETLFLAEKYKLRLYMSQKDGKFIQFDREKIEQYLRSRINKAISGALERLNIRSIDCMSEAKDIPQGDVVKPDIVTPFDALREKITRDAPSSRISND